MRVGLATGQGAGAGAAGPDDRDLVARPAGVPAPALRSGGRAGGRRPQGRGLLRDVPPGARAGCSRSRRRRSADRSTSSSPTCWPAARRRCASATARCATAARSATATTASSPTRPRRAPAPLVQLAHAKALREEWANPSEIQPLYLRPPDAEINWSTRAGRRARSVRDPGSSSGAMGVGAVAPTSVTGTSSRRDRADAPAGTSARSGDRGDAYPKPWSAQVFHDELREARAGDRHYVVARRGRRGDRLRRRDVRRRRRGPRHEHRRASRRAARRRGDAGCSSPSPTPRSTAAARRGPSRCGPRAPAPRSCTAGSASCPPASASNYYEGDDRRHRHVVPRHRLAGLRLATRLGELRVAERSNRSTTRRSTRSTSARTRSCSASRRAATRRRRRS